MQDACKILKCTIINYEGLKEKLSLIKSASVEENALHVLEDIS